MRKLLAVVGTVALAAVHLSVFASAPDDPTPLQIRDWTDAGRNEDAAEAARTLLERVEVEHGPRSREVAEALELLARALARAHQRDADGEAGRLQLAKRALLIRKEHPADEESLAWSYYVVGLVHYLAGSHAEAVHPFREALRGVERVHGEDHPATDVYLRELGAATFDTGGYEEALGLFERYLAVAVGKFGPHSSKTLPAYYNMALIHQVLGDMEQADQNLQGAETILRVQHPVDARNLVWVRNLRATLLENQGRQVESLRMFQDTLELALESLGSDSQEVLLLKNYLGRNLLNLGDYERAREVLLEALQDQSGAPPGFASCSILYNLGGAHHALGDLEAALETFEVLLRDAAGVMGGEHPLQASFHESYAATLQEKGQLASARTQIDRALDIRRAKDDESIHYAETLTHSASLHLATGFPEMAKEQLLEALDIIEASTPSNHRYYVAHEDLADALHSSGEATAAFEAAIRSARDSNEFDRATIALLPRRMALARALRPHIARDIALTLVLSTPKAPASWRRDALGLLLRSRATVFDEMVSRERNWSEAGAPEVRSLISEWTTARTRVSNLVILGPRSGAERYDEVLKNAQDRVERLELELAEVSEAHRERRRSGTDDIGTLSRNLRPGEALVSYVRFNFRGAADRSRTPHYAASILKAKDELPTWVNLGPAAEVDRLIEAWHAHFDPGRLNAATPGAFRAPGQALRQALWDPVADHLDGSKTAYIVPDSAVHLVSLTGLPVEQDAYLIDEGWLFHYLTAERDLMGIHDSSPSDSRGLLVVGNPAFNRRKNPASATTYRGQVPDCKGFRSRAFATLPGTSEEARVVKKLWAEEVGEPIEFLTGRKATEAKLKNSVSGHRVLHLATHGFFLGRDCAPGSEALRGIGSMSPRRRPEEIEEPNIENPLLLSGLILAGANHRTAGEDVDGEDGVLTAEEIGTLDLRGVELAVLSACETGAGSATEGEGMFGLRRAFLLAGARTVVTNLWQVEDRNARIWIERLYQERFVAGRPIPEAMHTASQHVLDLRRKAGLDTHPFYWAGWLAAGAS